MTILLELSNTDFCRTAEWALVTGSAESSVISQENLDFEGTGKENVFRHVSMGSKVACNEYLEAHRHPIAFRFRVCRSNVACLQVSCVLLHNILIWKQLWLAFFTSMAALLLRNITNISQKTDFADLDGTLCHSSILQLVRNWDYASRNMQHLL